MLWLRVMVLAAAACTGVAEDAILLLAPAPRFEPSGSIWRIRLESWRMGGG